LSKDVPFGEAFTSHEKWSVIQSGPNLKIHVTLSVRWKKAAWGFRSTIEKKTHEGTKAQIDLWFQSAQPIIEQYQRGMREFEDQKERAKISTNAALSSASLQNTTSALTASVSALQQLSTSDSDSENEEAQQDKKDHEVMRHIRRNSSLAGDLASLSSLQPSPRAAVPNPAILNVRLSFLSAFPSTPF
jgi:Mg2+ and Co2+ transporter CorA